MNQYFLSSDVIDLSVQKNREINFEFGDQKVSHLGEITGRK